MVEVTSGRGILLLGMNGSETKGEAAKLGDNGQDPGTECLYRN